MSPLTRPSSPVQTDNHPQIGHGHDAVLPPSRAHSFSHLSHPDMGHPKSRSHLEIILDTQHITLKGTGVDAEPSRLSGHLVLYLSEDMPLRELTLQFRGKARIPVSASESLVASNTSLVTHVIYNHEWSFLEGDKKHVRTVKAGRHIFPFHLQVDGSFPSSLETWVFGSTSIYYKLRAIAIRPGLNYNLQAVTPVHIDRSFSHEALEYQQTLEIESTWTDKIMYSILLPHKAWAAGDKLIAILKFSPLSKGVFVTRVRTSIQETIKIHARSGVREDTRTVASARHDIVGGKPVYVDPHLPCSPASLVSASQSQNAIAGPSTATTVGETSSSSRGSSTRASSPLRSLSSSHASPIGSSTSSVDLGEPRPGDNNDVVITIPLGIPPYSVAPTHSLEPIIVSHHVRWNIIIRNLDGHSSELRCSLPLHVLDHRLLEEARSLSAATRRLLLGSSELPPEEEEDRELPSYDAHIRDRVANMFLPDAATVRVNNPWLNRVSSGPQSPHDFAEPLPVSRGRSGYSTPLEPHTLSHLPHAPGPEGIATLNLLNSELLLSLSDSPLRRESFTPESHTPPDHTSYDSPQPQSRNRSQPHSRHNSRPPSPDGSRHHHHHGHQDGGVAHHGHGHSRSFHDIIRATIKPLTALGHSRFSRHSHHPHHDGHHYPAYSGQNSHAAHADQQEQNSAHPVTAAVPDHINGAELLHRAFTEVPDYSIASRGFIGGGVPPLESMRGLPSYEEASREGAQRAQSIDADLATGIASLGLSDGGSDGQSEERVSQ